MKKRIFIGLKISKDLQTRVVRWRKKFPDWPVRWTPEKNLHITLIPPFYEDNVRAINKKLRNTQNYPSEIIVEFNRIAFGPDPKRPRLIWAVGEKPPELEDLKKYLEKILEIPAEKRTFSLHLTLGRFKPEDFHHFSIKKLKEKISWKEKIKSIVLFESKLSRKGAEYEILEEIKLKK